MEISVWLIFVVTYAAVSVVPGPSVMTVVSQALTNGRRAAFLCILGDVTGGILLIALSLFGLGAVIDSSVVLYELIKWGGVCFLAWLGLWQIYRALCGEVEQDRATSRARVSVGIGFATGILNPKAIAFYTAFLAQFIDPTGNLERQFIILALTSTLVVGGVLAGYALMAARARDMFRTRRARRWFGIAGGGFLVGGSVRMASR